MPSYTSTPETTPPTPTHLVIFEEPSERNEDLVRAMCDVQEEPVRGASAGILAFRPRMAGAPGAKLMRSMAVAAVTLDQERAAEVERLDNVRMVVPNRRRSIPRLPRAQMSAGPEAGVSAEQAYLMGLRDAAELALGFGRGETPDGGGIGALFAPGGGQAIAAASSWALEMVGIRDGYPLTGAGVQVAVLDTGLDLMHPDFKSRVDDGTIVGRSFISGVATAQDGQGHGTHCAGVIAGPARPRLGPRYGVAPGVTLWVGKVLDDQGNGNDDDIVEGMQWAFDSGARIISMSLGSPRQADGAFSRLYENLAERMLGGQNGQSALLVAATGNDSERPFFTRPVGNPAACPSILGVGAVDRNGVIARFSDRTMDQIGRVDLAGPGVAVRSSWTGGGYWTESGTSMATPHVAGVAALMLEASPGLTALQLWDQLTASAKPLGVEADFGSGLVQAPA